MSSVSTGKLSKDDLSKSTLSKNSLSKSSASTSVASTSAISMSGTRAADAAPDCAVAERLHAMDHLRALAMLAGVLFHAALAHSVLMQPFWPTATGAASWTVDALVWLSHLVRMPLFFLVAGFFAAMLLQRRGMGGLMRQRLRRVLLPLLVAWPLVTLASIAAFDWALAHVQASNGVLTALRAAQAGAGADAPPLPLSTGHLWFLYYLLLFAVLLWIGRVLEAGRWLQAVFARGPWVVALGLPLLLAGPFALTSAPHPAPESLLPALWAIGLYGSFFALGVGLYGRLDWLAPLQRAWWPGVIVVLALQAVFVWRLQAGPVERLWPHAAWPTALLEAAIAAWGTLLCLLAGLRWLARPSAALRYLAGSAYTVYLLHLPLLFALQFALMDTGLSGATFFALSVAGTLAGCLLVYELAVRRTALRRWVG